MSKPQLTYDKQTGYVYLPFAKYPLARVFRVGRRKDKSLLFIPTTASNPALTPYFEEWDRNTLKEFFRKEYGPKFHFMFMPNHIMDWYDEKYYRGIK